jgi:hypothetical protein
VGHAAEGVILEPGASFDVDADTSEGSGEGFRSDSEAIGEGCDLVKFCRFLYT